MLAGKRRRTYMVQGDLRRNGRRISSVKVSVGDAAEIALRDAKTIAKSYLIEISRGNHPKAKEYPEKAADGSVTLKQAWQRYLDGHEHLDLHRHVLHLPNPKGGTKRAFDVPLSRQMIRCLVRAIRAGRMMYPAQAAQWLFPSDSATGYMREQKEPRKRLSKWGNDLRQTYRTLAASAGVSEIDCRLLMNHAIQGVKLVTSPGTNFLRITCASSNR